MPVPIRELIADSAHAIWISPASHWEIAIKMSAGKYSLPIPFTDFFNNAVQGNGFVGSRVKGSDLSERASVVVVQSNTS